MQSSPRLIFGTVEFLAATQVLIWGVKMSIALDLVVPPVQE